MRAKASLEARTVPPRARRRRRQEPTRRTQRAAKDTKAWPPRLRALRLSSCPSCPLFPPVHVRSPPDAAPVPCSEARTADIEGGYTDDLASLAETIRQVVGAGAVGINLEDGLRAPDLHARKIAAARQAADAEGVALYINARTDIYLRDLARGEAALPETLRRAALYLDAGASGIFVPGPADEAVIGALADGIKAPLNIMLRHRRPSTSPPWACAASPQPPPPSAPPMARLFDRGFSCCWKSTEAREKAMEVGSLAEWVGAVGSLMAVAAALLLGAFDRAEAVKSRRDLHDVRQAALADGRAVANSLSAMLYDAIHDLKKLAEVVGRSEAITRNTELHARGVWEVHRKNALLLLSMPGANLDLRLLIADVVGILSPVLPRSVGPDELAAAIEDSLVLLGNASARTDRVLEG